jgi:hypothetical protein
MRQTTGGGSDAARAQRDFLVLWLVVPLVFFSLSRSKLATYILPASVPAAMLAARYLAAILVEGRAFGRDRLEKAAWRAALWVLAVLPALGWLWVSGEQAGQVRWSPVVWGAIAAAGVMVIAAALWAGNNPRSLLGVLLVFTPALLVWCSTDVARFESHLGNQSSLREFGLAVRALAKPGDIVALVSHSGGDYGLEFYARRSVLKRRPGDPPPDLRRRASGIVLEDPKRLWEWNQQGFRILCVVHKSRMENWRLTVPVPLIELAQAGEHVLVTPQGRSQLDNQAESAGRL